MVIVNNLCDFHNLYTSLSVTFVCLTGKYVGRVSRDPGASLFIGCLPSYGQACW